MADHSKLAVQIGPAQPTLAERRLVEAAGIRHEDSSQP